MRSPTQLPGVAFLALAIWTMPLSTEGLVGTPGLVGIGFGVEAAANPAAETQRRWRRYRPRTRRLPPELRRLSSRAAITRAELAVLLSIRLERVLEPAARDHVVILTDTRDHWADPWVHTTARAGVMAADPTHKFEPDSLLQRRELAEAVAAVLELASERNPLLRRHLRDHRTDFADLEPTHISYRAAAAAVSAGVLDLARGGFFLPTATVGGPEALEVVGRLERLARG